MADKISLTVGGTTLASPTGCKITSELIWSENTGRGQSEGNIKMTGKCLGEKLTFDFSWNMITEAEFNAINNALTKGFFDIKAVIGSKTYSKSVYRSSIESEVGGIANGEIYLKEVSVTLVEQ